MKAPGRRLVDRERALPASGPGPARTCQYIGEAEGPPSGWSVCGKPSLPGRSYCGEHAAICYGQDAAAGADTGEKAS